MSITTYSAKMYFGGYPEDDEAQETLFIALRDAAKDLGYWLQYIELVGTYEKCKISQLDGGMISDDQPHVEKLEDKHDVCVCESCGREYKNSSIKG